MGMWSLFKKTFTVSPVPLYFIQKFTTCFKAALNFIAATKLCQLCLQVLLKKIFLADEESTSSE